MLPLNPNQQNVCALPNEQQFGPDTTKNLELGIRAGTSTNAPAAAGSLKAQFEDLLPLLEAVRTAALKEGRRPPDFPLPGVQGPG